MQMNVGYLHVVETCKCGHVDDQHMPVNWWLQDLPLKKEETKCNFKGCDCKEYHNRDKN
jgi:hypothetical protein